MNRFRPFHPFQLAIELCWDRGSTPRILVLADREGVVLPLHVKAKFEGQPVPIDLDPSYPMDPEFYDGRDGVGMRVALAFAGSVTTCSFPWSSILCVYDLETGEGFLKMVPSIKSKALDVIGPPKPMNETPDPLKPLKPLKGFKPRVIDGGKE